MRTFMAVLKHNCLRTIPRLGAMLTMVAVTTGALLLGVYLTRVHEVKGRVAFIAEDHSILVPVGSPQLEVDVVAAKPPKSDLLQQRYTAFAWYDQGGELALETLFNSDYEEMLRILLADPEATVPDDKGQRGVGVNIVGFTMMFVLMYSLWNLNLFAVEKEQGQLLRLASTPASLTGYLAAHCVYSLLAITPQFLLLAVLDLLVWDLGFTLWQHGGFLLAMGLMGTSLAFLLNSLIKKPDNADMLGNSIVVLTTVLAGGFYSFTKENAFLDSIIRLLPQKRLLAFANSMEKGAPGQGFADLVYIAAFSFLLLGVSVMILRRKYVKKG